MTLKSGTPLGPYEIVSPLGAGGMGEVYRARDTRLGREVAIKILPETFAADAQRLSRFEREARAASALNHPNILTIHDVGWEGAVFYVVSELLDGETLGQALSHGPLAPAKAAECAAQVARGLAVAHEKGIVHRDIKPENLFLTRDGRVKILDFGLARLGQLDSPDHATSAPTRTALTESGVVLGTVGYMSPEQVRGEKADSRADIFLLGAVLYEMLTGRRAFHRETAVETMHAILREEPPGLQSSRAARVPPALARVVARCLEKDPSSRFQSARDLAFALEEASGASAAAPPLVPAKRRLRLRTLAAVLVIAAMAGGLAFLLLSHQRPPAEAVLSIGSLAVLPLINLSGDPEQEFFADGLTEQLITDLAQISSLRVISRTSMMQYKKTQKSLPEIAQELDVEGVIEGSVLRSGDRVRVTAQLVHGPTDRHLWARSYDESLRDVLLMQRDVARSIAGEVRARLSPGEAARLGRAGPVNPEAFEHYLRGRYFWLQWTPEGMHRAEEEFRKALDEDPTYAVAYSGIADVYNRLGDMGLLAPEEAYPKAQAAARKALEIDPDIAEPHLSLGMSRLWYDWEFEDAEREIRRSLELNPGYATAHLAYSTFLRATGRYEAALVESESAHRLDPLSPVIVNNKGGTYLALRRFAEAEAQARKALELAPNLPAAHALLGRALAGQGRAEEAIEALRRAESLAPLSDYASALAYELASGGQTAEARSLLRQLEERNRTQWISPTHLAIIHVGLGEKDRALARLEEALSKRDRQLLYLSNSYWDPLRSDPRFRRIVRDIGLPDS